MGAWLQSPQKRAWLLGLLLVAATILAYQPVWRAGFIWDDDDYVTDNLALHSGAGLWRIWFVPGTTPQYYPLTFTSFWMEYHLWGVHPLGYHLINVGLHTLNALLVGLILRRLGIKGAWLGAGLFALHPVCVESVAWVTERKNTLSGLFFLGSILAGLRFWLPEATGLKSPGQRRDQDSGAVVEEWRWYWLALGLYVCALWSKTAGVGLPVVLLLVIWWKRGGLKRREVYLALPFMVVGVGLGLLTMWTEKHYTGAEGKQWAFTWGERCALAGRAVWFYLGKLVYPHPLVFVYPRWRIEATGVLSCVPALAAGLVVWVLWWKRDSWGRAGFLALGCYLVLLFPVLGFFDVYYFRYSFVADHFQYLAMLGPLGLALGGIWSVLGCFEKQRWYVEPVVCGVVLMVLGLLTWRQCGMYEDVETLWRATLARNPDSYLAHNDLGNVFLKRGQLDEAFAHFQKAADIQPDFPEARNNLGNALLGMGRGDEAAAQYQRALEIQPTYAIAHKNLGTVLLRKGQVDEALAHFQKALELRPDDAGAHNNLGNALLQKGQVDEAVAHYLRALEIQPDNLMAHDNLGVALLQKGRVDEAIAHFQRALELQPDDAVAHNNLGNALLRKGQVTAALAQYQKALEIRPGFAEAYSNLGHIAWILATCPEAPVRNGPKAIELAQQANRLSGGNNPALIGTLAAAYAEAGRFGEAVATARLALQLATAGGNLPLVDELRGQIELYQAGHPFRDPSLTNVPGSASLP